MGWEWHDHNRGVAGRDVVSMSNESKGSFVGKMSMVVTMTVVPMIILMMTATLYSIGHSNQLQAESNQRVAGQWAKQIDDNLVMVQGALASLTYIEPEFGTMGRDESELNVVLASRTIQQRMDTTMNAFSILGGLFMYSPQDNKWVERFAEGYYSYAFRQRIRDELRGEGTDTLDNHWTLRELEGESVLLYGLHRNGASMVALIDPEHLLTVEDDAITLAYLDLSGRQIGGSVSLKDTEDLLWERGRLYIEGANGIQYMAVSATLSSAPVRLVYAVSNGGYWDGLTPVQIALLLLAMLMLGMIPLSRYLIRRNLGRPLTDISESMTRIAEGEIDTQLTGDYKTRELEQVKTTFNGMMTRLQDLKIEVYERELDRQRAELQYRHLQLRPHFFLNCLKDVYALAQQKRYQDIQEMVLAVSKYIRYLFMDNQAKVPLRDELRYVEDYMQIQRLSHAAPPVCFVSVEEGLMDCMILPLSVEAFVENAVKHRETERSLTVRVSVVQLETEEGGLLDIVVRNDGGPFDETILTQLNSLSNDMELAGHVGLSNLKHRLQLVYGTKSVLAFYNDGDEAVCELICPIERAQYGERL